jgi:hypothetical protein
MCIFRLARFSTDILRNPDSPHRQRKKSTLSILTDGAWADSEERYFVKDQIKTFLRNVRKATELTKKALARQVSIQFIRFGPHLDETPETPNLKSLEHLVDIGSLLVYSHSVNAIYSNCNPRDIVDTEPANRNVYKMLLRSSLRTIYEDIGENSVVEASESLSQRNKAAE